MKKKDNLLLIISFFLLLFSIGGLVGSYNALVNFVNPVTGYASQAGSIDLSVTDYELVNFTSDSLINFGAGAVFENDSFATLDTVGGVYNGTWSATNTGFVIRNSGNVNVTLNFSTGKNAASFIGGSNPYYQYNISNVEDDACISLSGFNLNTFYNASTDVVEVCDYFVPNSSINIDFKLIIPYDSNLGNLTDSISVVHEVSS